MKLEFHVNDRWVALFKRLYARRNLLVGYTLGTLTSSLLVYAAVISKPYSFSDGTAISAAQVNSNFDTLYTEVNARESRISTLEAASWTKGSSGLYTTQSKVGIGTSTPGAKLEVTGGVKLGNDTTTCSTAIAGTIRWDGKNFLGCTGTAWVQLDNRITPTGQTQADAGETCATLLADNPTTSSGPYWIDPDGGSTSNAFQVYCDMATDRGGWTVLSINGDLTAHSCIHSIRSDASACGSKIDILSDWQLSGALQGQISFREILFMAYSGSSGAAYAASKLTLTGYDKVGNGTKTVSPSSITGISAMMCSGDTFATRTRLTVLDGYTVWGTEHSSCPSSVNVMLGMDVPTTGGGHDYQGWDDNNNGCGCGNSFSPGDISSYRGYIAVR